VYQHLARYCVLFVSKHYATRVWTNHERRSAQARALRENREYILPARFDDTEVPGLPPTVAYISIRGVPPTKFAKIIIDKVKPARDVEREDYFPPVPDRLFEALELRSEDARRDAESKAYWFYRALRRMTMDERKAVLTVFANTCPVGLPEDVHMSVDLTRRLTGFSEARLNRLLSGVSSLGVYADFDDGSEHGSQNVHLTFHSLSVEDGGPATDVAEKVVAIASEGYCEDHALENLMRLNFSNLASATFKPEEPHAKRRVRSASKRTGATRTTTKAPRR